MGQLVEGVWQRDSAFTRAKDGRFVRADSVFRDQVTADGSSGFKAEAGRYHLYVSLACPWAHRTLIYRKLNGLEDAISVSVVDPFMDEDGWAFSDGPGCIPDTLFGFERMHQVYTRADAKCSGRVTVPVLWDKQQGTIVNNESAEIIRMLNTAFAGVGGGGPDLYPAPLRAEIDVVNARVYNDINNGVYRTGFATTQAAYKEAFDELFAALDWVEGRLARQRYVCGTQITEADWRLFPTLLRFDPVYVGHFKCNLRRIADYPSLSNYLRELYQTPGIAETCDLGHIKQHYYRSHASINPTGIVPGGPEMLLHAPHNRGSLPLST